MARKSIPRDLFESDLFPGRPRILFVGVAESTHTHAWLNLLENAELNVRLFAVPTPGIPPADWRVRTYLSSPSISGDFDPEFRTCLYPTASRPRSSVWFSLGTAYGKGFWVHPWRQRLPDTFRQWLALTLFMGAATLQSAGRQLPWRRRPAPFTPPLPIRPAEEGRNPARPLRARTLVFPEADSAEEWLARVICDWQPHVIHSLGLFDNQGGEFCFSARKTYGLAARGKWVLQLRGGSDLTLRRHDPALQPHIREILLGYDEIISDNRLNIAYAAELGVPEKRFSRLTPVPGTGGLEVEAMRALWTLPPSRRERIIVWPKSYESVWSKALPVLEALRLAWDRIKPCSVHMLIVHQEVLEWYRTLPDEIRQHCHIHTNGIPRRDVFELFAKARVMLAPSLVDGIPNSMYEAMACGAFPIVSPIPTINSVVENERNVLFARNLYPDDIAAALVRALHDDTLVDNACERNLEFVRRAANRATIRERVICYYEDLAAAGDTPGTGQTAEAGK